MLPIGVFAFGLASVGFLLLTLLLAIGWEGRTQGARLIGACAATALWAAILAGCAWVGRWPDLTVITAESLRYAAWIHLLAGVGDAPAVHLTARGVLPDHPGGRGRDPRGATDLSSRPTVPANDPMAEFLERRRWVIGLGELAANPGLYDGMPVPEEFQSVGFGPHDPPNAARGRTDRVRREAGPLLTVSVVTAFQVRQAILRTAWGFTRISLYPNPGLPETRARSR